MSDEKSRLDVKYKIHAGYILFILLSIIVTLVTVQWSQVPHLAELLAFALTVSSLILSALAIAYAVYSNTSFSQSISTLNQVSTDVSLTAKRLDVSTADLSRQIASIPQKLELVETRVSETQQMMREYSDKVVKAEVQPAPEITGDKKIPDEDAEQIISYLLDTTSVWGLLILYTCYLAYTKKVPFSLKTLSDKTKLNDTSYTFGYLIGVSSVGVVTARNNEEATYISHMAKLLVDKLPDEIKHRLDSDEEDKRQFIAECKPEVEALFQS